MYPVAEKPARLVASSSALEGDGTRMRVFTGRFLIADSRKTPRSV
jgi:hypothetical protein